MIPYNGATICFVISILSAFGISAIRFERSTVGIKVCKIKVDGLIISENELLSVVHKIELIFHMAEHNENYKQAQLQALELAEDEKQPEPSLFSQKE